MAFVSEMFDQLRDLLNDASDTQVVYATKKLYLNRGIARLWPSVYAILEESLISDGVTREYDMPASLGRGKILEVRSETTGTSGEYYRYDTYDIDPGDEDSILPVFRHTGARLPLVGSRTRIRYATSVNLIAAANYAAAQSETWVGPDRAINLPVAYAMAMLTLRKLDDRQDTNRYNTTQALNGVTDRDIIEASQVWMGQFELELQEFAEPLPPARD